MTPDSTPDALLGLWLSEDGTRVLRIARDSTGAFHVTASSRDGTVVHLDARPAKWRAPDPAAAASNDARRRLGYLQVEVGHPGLGSTYDLMVAIRNTDPSMFGGYEWRPAPPDAPRDALRIFPEGAPSYWEAVLGYYDDMVESIRAADAWMQPLSTYRPATAHEEQTFTARRTSS